MNSIYDKFNSIKIRDRKYVRRFLTEWQYQLINKKRKLTLPVESVGNYLHYKDSSDLVNWMKWISSPFPNIFGYEFIKELSEKSMARDKEILRKLDLDFDFKNYHSSIGLFNAFDYIFPHAYPVPKKRHIKKILDFGAGYGRQANLWTADKENIYVGMDGIAKSYTLQNLYFQSISNNVIDYVEDPTNFKIEDKKDSIYHLPTWRYDLLPNNFFDLVICVQVLPELERKLVKTMIKQFNRSLKPGGMLYVYDHGSKWKPGSTLDIDRFITQNGFILEFNPYLADSRDIHGQIRIYRKRDQSIDQLNKSTLKLKYKNLYAKLDAWSFGMISKLVTFKKKYFK